MKPKTSITDRITYCVVLRLEHLLTFDDRCVVDRVIDVSLNVDSEKTESDLTRQPFCIFYTLTTAADSEFIVNFFIISIVGREAKVKNAE